MFVIRVALPVDISVQDSQLLTNWVVCILVVMITPGQTLLDAPHKLTSASEMVLVTQSTTGSSTTGEMYGPRIAIRDRSLITGWGWRVLQNGKGWGQEKCYPYKKKGGGGVV